MSRSRTILIALLGALMLSLVPAPSSAQESAQMQGQVVGKRCETSSFVKRCADLERQDGDIYANVRVESLRSRVQVRMLLATLQRRTQDGWQTVAQNRPADQGYFDGDGGPALLGCESAGKGVYRTRGKVQWKVRGQERRPRAVIVSQSVRRSRLCG